MSWRAYAFLALTGLLAVLLVAYFQSAPGYMDADYYFGGGQRLAGGHGFSELVLWNYLDDPRGLPHPSHGYWMPLTSILAAAGMALLGRPDFQAARLAFLLLAMFIPPMTAALAVRLNHHRQAGWFAGLLAVLPAFYLPYLSTSDSFSALMVIGALFFLLIVGRQRISLPRALGLGLLAGLIHLARADGLLWLAVAMLAAWGARGAAEAGTTGSRFESSRWLNVLACLVGYFLVMGPWLARNQAVFGAPLAPGGSRGLWILEYDELYLYPSSTLTAARWLQAGLLPALQARLWAAGQNLQTGLAVQGGILLAPLELAGLWRLRSERAVRLGGLAWLLTFLAMTLAFPFQGARGGFFHSGAALQPFLWALAPAGLDALVGWGARRRGWNFRQAQTVFRAGLLLMAMALGVTLTYLRVAGSDGSGQPWNGAWQRYQKVEAALAGFGAQPGEIVMANNAPGYFAAADRPAVSIPLGDLQTVQVVAQRYDARYLVVEMSQILGADDLYGAPGDRPGLQYLGSVEGAVLYRFIPSKVSVAAAGQSVHPQETAGW